MLVVSRVPPRPVLCQEMANEVLAATRPLMRQIEQMQQSHMEQQEHWERAEVALSKQLDDVHEKACAVAFPFCLHRLVPSS